MVGVVAEVIQMNQYVSAWQYQKALSTWSIGIFFFNTLTTLKELGRPPLKIKLPKDPKKLKEKLTRLKQVCALLRSSQIRLFITLHISTYIP